GGGLLAIKLKPLQPNPIVERLQLKNRVSLPKRFSHWAVCVMMKALVRRIVPRCVNCKRCGPMAYIPPQVLHKLAMVRPFWHLPPSRPLKNTDWSLGRAFITSRHVLVIRS